jgi:putative transposase
MSMAYGMVNIPAAIAQVAIGRVVTAIDRWMVPDVNGNRLGKPRFKVEGRFKTNGFAFPVVDQRHVRKFGRTVSIYVPKVGWVKGRISERDIAGRVKQVGIKCDACGDFWVTIVTDTVKKTDLPEAATESIGVDLGIKTTVSASNVDGTIVVQPERKKFLDAKNLEALKHASNRDRKALPFVHRKIARRREDYNWKLARKVVSAANNIYVGDVAVKWLISGRLSRQASDIALGSLKNKMSYLAASADRHFEEINEAWTSKTCSGCGTVKESLKLSDRVFACSCGLVLDRDLNAARNIARKGEQLRLSVETEANNQSSQQSQAFSLGS